MSWLPKKEVATSKKYLSICWLKLHNYARKEWRPKHLKMFAMGKRWKVFRCQKVIGKCAPKFPVIIFPQLWKRNTSKIPQSSRLKGILSIQSLSSMTSHRLLCTENNFWAVKKKALIHKSKYKKPNPGDITAECVMLILRVIKNTLKGKNTRILGEKQTQSSTYPFSLNWLTSTIEETNSDNKKSHQNQKIR